MHESAATIPGSARLRLADIDFSAVERDKVQTDPLLFHLVATASFTETTSDLFTRNLVNYYTGSNNVVTWLTSEWEPEELGHGRALRSYIATVWPDFDWQRAYDGFLEDYSKHCTLDELQPSRALEMVARCVVEMGTATYYRALSEFATEPVLKTIATRISQDEVRHYKHFHQFFLEFDQKEKNSTAAISRTIVKRLAAIRSDDGYIAFRHVFHERYPGRPFSNTDYIQFNDGMRRMYREFYPFRMASRMLVRPLGLRPAFERGLAGMIARSGNVVAMALVVTTAMRLLWAGDPEPLAA